VTIEAVASIIVSGSVALAGVTIPALSRRADREQEIRREQDEACAAGMRRLWQYANSSTLISRLRDEGEDSDARCYRTFRGA